MSATPKYHDVELEAERRQQLAAQQAAEAERRQQRRLEAERLERARRLHIAVEAGNKHAASLLDDFKRFEASGDGSLVAEGLATVIAEVRIAQTQLASAIDEQSVRAFRTHVDDLRSLFERIVIDARAKRLALDLQAREAALVDARQFLNGLDHSRWSRFCPNGMNEATAQLTAVRKAIGGGDPEAARRLLNEACEELHRQQDLVARRSAEWRARSDRAASQMEMAGDALAGLSADPAVAQWQAAELENLTTELHAIKSLLAQERFDAVMARADAMVTLAAQVIEEARKRQAAEMERQFVAEALAKVLHKLGSLVVQRTDAGDGAIVVEGRHVVHGRMVATVASQGEVAWEVEGPKHVKARSAGVIERTCPNIEERLTQISEELRRTFGVKLSRLRWQDRPANDTQARAKPLPAHTTISAPRQRTTRA